MSSKPPSSQPIAPDPLPNSPNSLMTMPETPASKPSSATSPAESNPHSPQASPNTTSTESKSQSPQASAKTSLSESKPQSPQSPIANSPTESKSQPPVTTSPGESKSQAAVTSSPIESKPQSAQSAQSAPGTPSPQATSPAGQLAQVPQAPYKALRKPEDIPYYGFRTWISSGFTATFLGGGIAGAVSRTVVSPLERLKILLQVQNVGRNEYKMSIGKALGKMWREEGWRGMMAGNGTNCIRIVPYSAVQFASYNVYKKGFEAYPGADLGPISRLACGAVAGVTSVTVTYPLDIVRTRLSIQSASFASLAKEKSAAATEAAARKLPGMWGIMKHMYAKEGGITALYKGIIPTVAGVAPYVGLNFMIYESVRTYFTPEGQAQPGPIAKLGAGAVSGAMAQTITYPLDVLRRRFQINSMDGMGFKYNGIMHAVRSIVAQEGLKGLYKGITPNLLKVAPSMASSWLTFETMRDFFVDFKPEVDDDE